MWAAEEKFPKDVKAQGLRRKGPGLGDSGGMAGVEGSCEECLGAEAAGGLGVGRGGRLQSPWVADLTAHRQELTS